MSACLGKHYTQRGYAALLERAKSITASAVTVCFAVATDPARDKNSQAATVGIIKSVMNVSR
jgi:hypothetical protein